jgi:hypothetical protein
MFFKTSLADITVASVGEVESTILLSELEVGTSLLVYNANLKPFKVSKLCTVLEPVLTECNAM